MDQMITANISLDFFSIILSLVPVLYLLSSQRYKQRRNQYFLGICISNIFMILGDLGDWSIRDVSSMGLKMSLYALTALFYIASAFVLYFFARYISEYLQLFGRIQTVFLVTVTVICGI